MGEKYPYRVLFVEDEEELRKNYVTYLEMIFEEVLEAKDGEEALRIYKTRKPHIMIVDIHLPLMSGLEFLHEVRTQDHTTRAIMLTAHTDTPFLIQAAALKLTCYLTKPISRKALQEGLDAAIEEIRRFETKALVRVMLDDSYSWDRSKEELFHFDRNVTLSKKEQQLLSLLFSDTKRTFTYDEIFERVWGYEQNGTLDALKSLVKTLRKKLPEKTIHNVFGIGYRAL
jgi:two-component system, OmpR family, response regulator VanR